MTSLTYTAQVDDSGNYFVSSRLHVKVRPCRLFLKICFISDPSVFSGSCFEYAVRSRKSRVRTHPCLPLIFALKLELPFLTHFNYVWAKMPIRFQTWCLFKSVHAWSDVSDIFCQFYQQSWRLEFMWKMTWRWRNMHAYLLMKWNFKKSSGVKPRTLAGWIPISNLPLQAGSWPPPPYISYRSDVLLWSAGS